MKHKNIQRQEWKPFYRFTFALIGLLLAAEGALRLFASRLHYHNYWGAPVFTPFAILVGILIVIFALTYRKAGK
jgi:hypothetical protein